MDAFTLGDKSNSELSHLNIESQKKISLKGKTEKRGKEKQGLLVYHPAQEMKNEG